MGVLKLENRVLEDLEAFGLTSLEAKTYITLLSFREATITMLARSMGLHAAQLYGILEKLVQKGFVVEQPGRPKVYRAVMPRTALDRIIRDLAERRDRIVNALSGIAKRPMSLTTPPIWLVKGHRNIVETMQDLIDRAKVDILLSISHTLLPSLFTSLREARSRGVEIFVLLFPPSVPRNLLSKVTGIGRVRLGRRGDLVLITDMAKCLYIQHAMLSSMGLKSYALLTGELSLVDLFMHNFIRQWSTARPINDFPTVNSPHRYTCHRLALLVIDWLMQKGFEVHAEVEGVRTRSLEECRITGKIREVVMDLEEGIYNFLLETEDGSLVRIGGIDAYLEDVAAHTIKIWVGE
ncbi:MAG: hypothetical protein DRJ43_05700 [Thermoprotei archaeon]|nr:MAG: hypothetical protein DRJ43_05700 [Thermoprotei archaeon]